MKRKDGKRTAQLSGKSALVTGSTAGIGLAVALGLAREDAYVAVNGRTQPRVDEAIANIKSAVPNANVRGFALDLGSQTSHTAIMARSLGIPAVVGLRNATEILETGVPALIDGYHGLLIIHPSEQTLREYE
jgi:NAD(P)-dependent dehydrogenase (short-subunit alcohol dehydrogenase family)